MKLAKLAIAVATALAVVTPAAAEMVFPLLSYRTGPYAPNGIPFADGVTDYFNMLNGRDGGIGGVKIRVLECETAYNTDKGVECYESTRTEGALYYQPLSTGITYQLIPKVTADDIPLHSMGYGRTSAANGKVFSNIFNFPGTYWDAASIIVKHILDQEVISGPRLLTAREGTKRELFREWLLRWKPSSWKQSGNCWSSRKNNLTWAAGSQ